MAECPGVLELAAMADGGLARLRTPGGRLASAQARTVADAAARLGSGVIDLTNRANLQIRGLAPDAGPALGDALAGAGLLVEGPADRRRNILLDPFSGADPGEICDLSGLARDLEAALGAAPWIGALSPKFSFALDGGGRAGVSAVPSDVSVRATRDGIVVGLGRSAFRAAGEACALLVAIARAAAETGPRARSHDIPAASVAALAEAFGARPSPPVAPRGLKGLFGAVETKDPRKVALSVPVPVGRLDPGMLHWIATLAEEEGEGVIALAPWSAIVVPGVDAARADGLLAGSVRAGFLPVGIAGRLTVIACAGAPSCERAREPAKALGAEILKLAADHPDLLPGRPARVHLSACPKGCAGSPPADLLLLGASDRDGWTLHRAAAPRAPGASLGRLGDGGAREILRRLAATG